MMVDQRRACQRRQRVSDARLVAGALGDLPRLLELAARLGHVSLSECHLAEVAEQLGFRDAHVLASDDHQAGAEIRRGAIALA